MRTLPTTPNLEHLKQQAKDLLDALRETRPEATLADAQRAVAEQYGFRRWTDLKHEVEQLRETPELADQELIAAIAETFELGDLTGPGVVVAYELSCPVLRIETGAGRWEARGLLPWMTDDQLARGIGLMEAAASAGVRTPTPKRSASGSLAEEVGGSRWRVDEWIDLGPAIVKPIGKAHALKIGEVLGTLHALHIAPDIPIGDWTGKRHSPERWQEVLGIMKDHDAPWAAALEAALPTIQDLMTVATEPPGRDLILSHNDLWNAVHTSRDGSLTVVGWEFAGATPPAWELGSALHALTETSDGGLNTSVVPSILEGYASAFGSRPKIDLPIFAMAINGWDSWTLSRMNIALSEERDDRDRALAVKELDHILRAPLSRERLQEIVHAAAQPAGSA